LVSLGAKFSNQTLIGPKPESEGYGYKLKPFFLESIKESKTTSKKRRQSTKGKKKTLSSN
jgi:hypothetical protein